METVLKTRKYFYFFIVNYTIFYLSVITLKFNSLSGLNKKTKMSTNDCVQINRWYIVKILACSSGPIAQNTSLHLL